MTSMAFCVAVPPCAVYRPLRVWDQRQQASVWWHSGGGIAATYSLRTFISVGRGLTALGSFVVGLRR